MSNPTHEFKKKKTSGATPHGERSAVRQPPRGGRARARRELQGSGDGAEAERVAVEGVAVGGSGGEVGEWGEDGGGVRRRKRSESGACLARFRSFRVASPLACLFLPASRSRSPRPLAPLLPFAFARRAFNPRARARGAAGFR
ncbi:hypothetical protein PVAP13_1KG079777 [Panicum virgatum]|uniref:Uncharacterized protein n=1 Tax=Panicum virgatum TaxID=38727 RepID=A0A8T0XG98_PANVG|nr:hypothetical protein PVAP13_1KG079777 [Panicum virgatum]